MGVYSELKKDSIEYIEKNYNIKVDSVQHIEMGILNSNFLIKTANKKYILRIFEATRTLEEEELELDLLQKIQSFLPVSKVFENIENKKIIEFKNKKVALFEFIEGDNLKLENINQQILREIAWYLGKFHKFSENSDSKNFDRKSRIDFDFYLEEINKSDIEFEEKEKILNLATEIKNISFEGLPKGIIHSDIFPDNVMVKNNHITGIIDFNEATSSYYIYDLAIIIVFWIKAKKYKNFQVENDLIRDFLNNYSRHRKITREEIKLLHWACKKMLLTFVILRIYMEKINKNYSIALSNSALKIEEKSYLSLIGLLDFI